MKYIGIEYDSNFPVDLFERLLNEVGTLYFVENPEKSFGVTSAALTEKKEVKTGKRRGRRPKQAAPDAPPAPPAVTQTSPVTSSASPVSSSTSVATPPATQLKKKLQGTSARDYT